MNPQNKDLNTIPSVNNKDTLYTFNMENTSLNDSIKATNDTIIPFTGKNFAETICNSHQEVDPVTPIGHLSDNYERSPWFITTLVIFLIVVSKIKLSFPKLLSLVFQAFVKYSVVSKLSESRNSRNSIGYFFMNSLALLTTSVLILELGICNSIILKVSFYSLLYITIGVLSFFLFKIIIIKTLGYLFNSNSDASEYVFNLLLIWKSVGMMLIPIVVSIPFINYSAVYILNIIGMVIILFAYVLIILRGLRILFLKHVSLLYMILYLCALEIVPILIIYKILLA